MSISLPTYTRREAPLLGRGHRVRAIATAGLRREFRRIAAIFVIAAGTLVTVAVAVLSVIFAPFLLQGQPLDVSFFYFPASSGAILFFVTLMAAVIGGGLIADDVASMALTLYLSRPITAADYLAAKAGILGGLVAMVSVLPLSITPIAAGLLGLFSWTIALPALAISISLGLLLTAFYVSVALLLSSLTRRRGFAAAGMFALTFGLMIPATLLAGAIGNPSILYLSPWNDYLAVAGVAFGVANRPIDWLPALAILLGATAVASLVTYLRLRSMEVVTG